MRIPIVSTLVRAGYLWNQDRASYLGAAMAYNALFSIAPLIIIAIGVVGLVYGETEVKTKIIAFAQDYVGREGALALQDLVEQFWRPTTSIWATIVGVAVLVVAATNLFLQMGTALGMIWNLPQQPHRGWFIPLLQTYLFAFAMVIMTAAFFFVIVASDALFTYVLDQLGEDLPGGMALWYWMHLLLYVLLFTIMMVFTFRFLSHRMIPYRKLWGGALTAAVLFLIGRLLFGLYIKHMGSSLATAFGASSSIVIFLIWIYYSSQILFFGAEVVKVQLERRLNG